MPTTFNPLRTMVSESVATQYSLDPMSMSTSTPPPPRQWSSATYTSSAPPTRPLAGGRSSEASLRESMARLAAATQLHSAARRRPLEEMVAEIEGEGESEEDYMRAREHHEDIYWRAREQAHAALAELQHQRQHQEALRSLQQQQQQPPPSSRSSRPPSQHRVYLINCKSCGNFLTDRGMKAVLLLRPHITLYSTDAVPNCGPLYPPSHSSDPIDPNEPIVERTCNCLTQTLGCYGCGNAVGYHIVSPCSRCTSSVAKHQRSSNGHRTVLHCAEISVRERRYVPGELGVMTATPIYPSPASNGHRRGGSTRSNMSLHSQLLTRRSMDAFEDMTVDNEDNKDNNYLPFNQQHAFDDVLDPSSRRSIINIPPPPPAAAATGDRKGPRIMKRGDNVYWSDLVSSGERFEPIDSDEALDMPVAGR